MQIIWNSQSACLWDIPPFWLPFLLQKFRLRITSFQWTHSPKGLGWPNTKCDRKKPIPNTATSVGPNVSGRTILSLANTIISGTWYSRKHQVSQLASGLSASAFIFFLGPNEQVSKQASTQQSCPIYQSARHWWRGGRISGVEVDVDHGFSLHPYYNTRSIFFPLFCVIWQSPCLFYKYMRKPG